MRNNKNEKNKILLEDGQGIYILNSLKDMKNQC